MEMVLVKMLRERRSWSDYMEIADALWNVRRHAESMKKEHDMMNADCGRREGGYVLNPQACTQEKKSD